MDAVLPVSNTVLDDSAWAEVLEQARVEIASAPLRPRVEDDLADCVTDLSLFSRDSAFIARLDRVIAAGDLFAKSDGARGGQRIVAQGVRAFTEESRTAMRERQESAALVLDSLFRQSFLEELAKADGVMLAAAYFLTAQTPNEELVSLAKRIGQHADLCVQGLKTASLGMAISLEMGSPLEDVRLTGLCGLIHDWGMIKVPSSVRDSKLPLSTVESAVVKQHPAHVFSILEKLAGVPSQLPLVCGQVHESPNGKGYPRGRKHHAIHPLARIVRVADTYVALTSPRPWRAALTPNGAMECLLAMSGENRIDSEVVNKLLSAVSLFPTGSIVELTDGSLAQTVRPNGLRHSQPFCRLIRDSTGRRVENGPEVDLVESGLRIVRALSRPGANETPLTAEIMDRCLR
jgi:HD-GYP domain-containing protein (c-di-GMP phosphodiesterase class II)